MAEEAVAQESLEFRAEVQQLLNILAHSLYTEREIFLRELISNASDALNRIQFELLTNREVRDPDAELAIRISFDEKARTLTVSDSGIGMTHDELIENLGTIAHSGALAFMKGLEEGKRPVDIIGQFGVGFYSVFMVAEEVRVRTLSYRLDAQGWEWTSQGGSRFTLAPADVASRGTTVEIQLKEDAAEFGSAWRLEQTVRRHSDYVSWPIYVGDKVANRQTALWRKTLKEVGEGEYDEFYRQLTLDTEPPLLHIHLITDAPVNIRSILYVPRHFDRGTFRAGVERGVRLYSHKVLIQEHAKDLLPEHLAFVEGVVDSEDIPLNISRETVQSNRVMRQIQKVLAGRIVKELRDLAKEMPEDYKTFWEQFGAFIRQGVVQSPADREDLLPLLRFRTSKSNGEFASLDDYVGRMIEGQDAIYYLLAADDASVDRSPHLDPFRERDLEVLYLLDPFDGLLVQSVREFKGKTFQNVDAAGLKLPGEPKEKSSNDEPLPEAPDLAPLMARIKEILGERVAAVQPSDVLTGSPARLVSQEGEFDRDLARVRRLLEEDYDAPARALEINPRHALIRNLARLVNERPADPVIGLAVEQLFENLLLIEGLHKNPAEMVPRLQTLLEAATNK